MWRQGFEVVKGVPLRFAPLAHGQIPETAAFMQRAYADTYPEPGNTLEREDFLTDEFHNNVLQHLRGSMMQPERTLVVARQDEEIIATAGLDIRNHNHSAHIWGNYVEPASQKTGVGQTMWDIIMKMAVKASVGFVRLDVVKHAGAAIKLYKRNGMNISGETRRPLPEWMGIEGEVGYLRMHKWMGSQVVRPDWHAHQDGSSAVSRPRQRDPHATKKPSLRLVTD